MKAMRNSHQVVENEGGHVPAPSRTSVDAVVRAGAAILDERGPDGLTMQAVAAAVGVRAPSLYKHVDGRDALVRLIVEAAADDLGERLAAAAPDGGDPAAGLRAAADAVRAFAHERPAAFRLVFAPGPEPQRPGREALARASATVLRLAGELAGPDAALPAARTVTAWVNGFVAMELAGAFRLGGDVDEAWDWGIRHLTTGLHVADDGAASG